MRIVTLFLMGALGIVFGHHAYGMDSSISSDEQLRTIADEHDNENNILLSLDFDDWIDKLGLDYRSEALFYECSKSAPSYERVQQLILNKANVSYLKEYPGDGNLYMPLHGICAQKNPSIALVKLLVEHKACVNDETEDHHTPLNLICFGKNPSIDIIKFLINNKAHVNSKEQSVYTPLHYLCYQNDVEKNLEAIKFIIEARADLTSKDNEDQMPLHILCNHKNMSINAIKLLIENKSEVNAEDGDHLMPLQSLCYLKDSESRRTVIKMLIENKADINRKNHQGDTALHAACGRARHTHAIIRFLIENNAQINIQNEKLQTPLHIVCKGNFFTCKEDRQKIAIKNANALISSIINVPLVQDDSVSENMLMIVYLCKTDSQFRAMAVCFIGILKIKEKEKFFKFSAKFPKVLIHEIFKLLMIEKLEPVVKKLNEFINKKDENNKTALMIARENNRETNNNMIMLLEGLEEALLQGYKAVFEFLKKFDFE